MEVQFLEGQATDRAIRDLTARHQELHWAVAWGSFHGHGKSLLKHKAKFRNVTFGVAFSQTHPDLIDALVGVPGAHVATRFKGGTFHPKVYVFRSGAEAAAIVGSANFTGGAFGTNREATLLITGQAAEPVFGDLLRFVKESHAFGEPVSPDFAKAYRASFERAARLEKPDRDPVPLEPAARRQLTSSTVSMSWKAYVQAVRASAEHDVDKSLELLRTAQRWFAATRSFRDLDPPYRKAIAGTLGDYQKDNPELALEWGWFGSMRGAGDFMNRVEANDRYLAEAVDSIPRQGLVRREDYERFVTNFVRAFRNSQRVGKVATASRLLAPSGPTHFSASAVRISGRPRLSSDSHTARLISLITGIASSKSSVRPAGTTYRGRAVRIATCGSPGLQCSTPSIIARVSETIPLIARI